MTSDDAKKTLASYLVGRRVKDAELREAVDAVASDAEYAEHVRRELGLHDDWVTECDVFRARLDELAEMSASDQQQKLPDLARHLRTCPACQRMFWRVRSTWSEDAATEPGSAVARTLVDPVAVSVGSGGKLGLSVQSRPCEEQVPLAMAARAGVPEGAPFEPECWREWTLADPDAAIEITLLVVGQPTGEPAISCRVTTADGSPVDPDQVRLTVRDAAADEVFTAGPLSMFEGGPVVLAPGPWLLCVEWTAEEPPRRWTIPLELERGSDDG